MAEEWLEIQDQVDMNCPEFCELREYRSESMTRLCAGSPTGRDRTDHTKDQHGCERDQDTVWGLSAEKERYNGMGLCFFGVFFPVILFPYNNMNELGCVSNMVESPVGNVLVPAPKHNLVLLHQTKWKRCKWPFAIFQFKKRKNLNNCCSHSWTWEEIISFAR